MYIWIAFLLVAVLATAALVWVYVRNLKNLDSKRKKIITSVLAVCVAVNLVCAAMITKELLRYKESADAYSELESFVNAPIDVSSDEMFSLAEIQTSLPINFDTLKEKAPDVVAWIKNPNSVINYPVVYTDNNDFYLNHLYDKTYNQAGCPFIDCRNKPGFADKNTVIYGHNMLDGSMFASLKKYMSQEYYDAHPSMILSTPEQEYTLELFSAFEAEVSEYGSDTSPWKLSWSSDDAYASWLESTKARSAFKSNVEVSAQDKVITLSTCTARKSSRYIVVGKMSGQDSN